MGSPPEEEPSGARLVVLLGVLLLVCPFIFIASVCLLGAVRCAILTGGLPPC